MSDPGEVLGWFLVCRDGNRQWRAYIASFAEGEPIAVVWEETTTRSANGSSTVVRLAERFELRSGHDDWELDRDAEETAAAIRVALSLPNKPPSRYELFQPARFAASCAEAFR